MRSEQLDQLAAALVKAQAAIQPAVKDKTNPAFRSRYADLASVWEACRKPLTDNGLSIIQMPVEAAEPGRIALETLLLHVSGQYIASVVSAPLVKNDPQGVGSALTYLRRYALAAMVGVVADEDDDGNAASKTAQAVAAHHEPTARQVANGAQPTTPTGDVASDKQIGLIKGMTRKGGWDEAGVLAWAAPVIGPALSFAHLTKRQASDLITALKDAEAPAESTEG